MHLLSDMFLQGPLSKISWCGNLDLWTEINGSVVRILLQVKQWDM